MGSIAVVYTLVLQEKGYHPSMNSFFFSYCEYGKCLQTVKKNVNERHKHKLLEDCLGLHFMK